MTDKIRQQIAWLTAEADLYDMQGLSVDAKHADDLYAIRDSIERLLEAAEEAYVALQRITELRADGWGRQSREIAKKALTKWEAVKKQLDD